MSENIFKKSVKPFEVEELVDYFFFRRLASLFVPLFIKLKWAPNQVTTLALVVGLGCGSLFFHSHFFLGGLGLLLTVVLDCVDGQLARATKQTSEEGRILDGIFDHIWVTAIWVGIFLSDQLDSWGVKTVVVIESLAGVSIILHCAILIKIKTEFLQIVSPEYTEKELTKEETSLRFKKALKEFNLFHLFVYGPLYMHMLAFGEHKNLELPQLSETTRQKGRELLGWPMRMISFTGEGTHHALMITFALLSVSYGQQVMMYNFLVVLIPMNIWWVAALSLWKKRKKLVLNSNETTR